jgi:hypothetical protein
VHPLRATLRGRKRYGEYGPRWAGRVSLCVEYFGKRDSERFPTIEEYEAALERYPEPMWASEEEFEREDPYLVWTSPASRIART